MSTVVKQHISESIQTFAKGNLTENALNLFKTLGYNTERQAPLDKPSRTAFKESFIGADSKFNEEKALFEDWEYVDLLFQLSNEELNFDKTLFKKEVKTKLPDGKEDRTIMETYLFFAIELGKDQYSRTDLSRITREVNRLFPMPVMILFKTGNTLTLSVINRRLNKKDDSKDVLKKVTLIKDIRIENPHRAHIEILFDLSFDELRKEPGFKNFVELHNAWQKTLDIKELNNRFFKELSNWYFWAKNKKVSFPDDIESNEEIRNATNLIRLITRVIFIWFIKEKSLVSETFFDKTVLKTILKEFCIDKSSSSYYKAILQNLFFGTLNQKMDERYFARNNGYPQNVNEYGVKNLFRYADLFNLTEKEVLSLFKNIPFLNGGLFDCLDKPNDDGIILYVDGFSRNHKKQANVPDFLFFADEHQIDLNKDYGTKNKKYKVKGLIEILSNYKFTITENTPIEEEVALDPELLGRVFENLLASYNQETQTTARKQTGSFYTPREIVNYMVDESLKAHLKQKLAENAGMKEEEAEIALNFLFEYNEKELLFDKAQTEVLINAIDTCKILDPACGSGAFPMGILHKLVHILDKLDPNNEQWKDRQIEKAKQIDDIDIRDKLIKDIEEAFACNELDYGRKLYLIENCIFGVDIQPIAVQIAKLRFFISLVVDQRKQVGKENFGIRALPNLETKFVTANTLIGIDKPNQMNLQNNPTIKDLEKELKNLRHEYFSAKTRNEKLSCQKKDKDLRKRISKLLIQDGWDNKSAELIAEFDPYDQNSSSPFFDPEWMFGLISSPLEEGKGDVFDVVIGNPPYVKEDVYRNAFDGVRNSRCYQGKMDLWYLFGAKALDVLKANGVLCFIATNNWISNDGASKFRDKVIQEGIITNYMDFGNHKVFSASIQTMVFVIIKNTSPESYKVKYGKLVNVNADDETLSSFLRNENDQSISNFIRYDFKLKRSNFKGNYISFISPSIEYVIEKIAKKCDFHLSDDEVFSGIDVMQDFVSKIHLEKLQPGYRVGQGIFVLSNEEKEAIRWNEQEKILIKPYYTTKEINRYFADTNNRYWILYTSARVNTQMDKFPNIKKHLDQFQDIITSVNKPYGLHRTREQSIFVGDKILSIRKCSAPAFSFVDFSCYVSRAFLIIKSRRINMKYLVSLFNSKIIAFWLWHKGKLQGNNYQIDKEPLMLIPIIATDKESQNIVSITSEYIVTLKTGMSGSLFFERIIDSMCYELYFPNEIKAADCEVLKHLNHLPELKNDWSYEQKLQAIEKIYQELSNPKHPVSIAMEKMKTVSEVRIIEGMQ